MMSGSAILSRGMLRAAIRIAYVVCVCAFAFGASAQTTRLVIRFHSDAVKLASATATTSSIASPAAQRLAARNASARLATAKGIPRANAMLLPHTVATAPLADADAAALRRRLAADLDVLSVSPSRPIFPADTIPNDPSFANQWPLRNVGQTGGTPGADISASSAWDVTTGSASTILAIVDSGTDAASAEYASRLWVNPGEIAANSIDDDGNGLVDDINGWNFCSSSPNINPTSNHGTRVAGIAAATGNNGIGVAGVDWRARIMTLVSFPAFGPASDVDVIDACVYAIDNGARVINASWGSSETSPQLDAMIEYAQLNDVLICAASGNSTEDLGLHPFYPAAAPYSNVLSIGATKNDDTFTYNFGAHRVQISAPGFQVPTMDTGNNVGTGNGTSYAPPLATGATGLLLAQQPTLRAYELRGRLANSGTLLSALADRNLGARRLNVSAALAERFDTVAPNAPAGFQLASMDANSALLTFNATADSASLGALRYVVRVTTGALDASNFLALPAPATVGLPPAIAGRQPLLINGLAPNTTYRVAVAEADKAGNLSAPSAVQLITTPAPPTAFFDDANTTSPVWVSTGDWQLEPGYTNTGTLAWHDSPGALYPAGTSTTLESAPISISGMSAPRLTFYLATDFAQPVGQSDGMIVQASGDGGATWRTLRAWRSTLSPSTFQSLPLDDFVSGGNVRLRFVRSADVDVTRGDGAWLDDIRVFDAGTAPLPTAPDTIWECYDFAGNRLPSADMTTTGVWFLGSGGLTRPALIDSINTLQVNVPAPGAEVHFTPLVPAAGRYEVSIAWPTAGSATNVAATVVSLDGTSSTLLTQNLANSNRWASLGEHTFAYGRNPMAARVSVSASTASGLSVALHGLRLRYLGPATGAARANAEWLRAD